MPPLPIPPPFTFRLLPLCCPPIFSPFPLPSPWSIVFCHSISLLLNFPQMVTASKHCLMTENVLIFFCIISLIFGREILSSICPCRDWHGGCRQLGENWVDNGIWAYRCAIGAPNSVLEGCQVISKSGEVHKIETDQNKTVDGFWIKCEKDEIRQKLEFEPKCVVGGEYKRLGEIFRKGIFQWICMKNGRRVIGCYYRNETDKWNLLKLGETVYEGLIRHNCDRNRENPGRVQFHSEIREDILHQSPSNKGKNKMLPEFVDKSLKNIPIEWTHENVPLFVAEMTNVRIRYLLASRKANAVLKNN